MLDISAFSNALLSGSVSCLQSLHASVATDSSGHVRVYAGEDAAVFPLYRGDVRSLAYRVPLSAESAESWPATYADLATAPVAIRRFLPENLAILDSDVPGEPPLALLYDWVPGESLADTLRFTTNPDRLHAVVDGIVDLASALPASGYAHGDIAPGNVVVRPDNSVVLIDLDRMAPSSAFVAPRRRPGYRLADSTADAAAEDAFALLVMMTSVAIVAGSGELSYQVATERGPHAPLVFSSWDLLDPGRSELIHELDAALSGLPALLLEYLVGACGASADQVPGILGEAVHDVRRTPRRAYADRSVTRPSGAWTDRPRTDGTNPAWGNDTWDDDPWSPASFNADPDAGRDESVPDGDTWNAETWDNDPWSPASFNADPDAGEHELAAAATATDSAHVEQILERLVNLASSLTVVDRPNRHRLWVEHRREQVGSELRQALETNDREVLVRLAMSGDLAELGDSDRADLVQVLRALSHDHIARAVKSDLDDAIMAAVDPEIFGSDSDIDSAFRPRVRLARERRDWIEQAIMAVQQDEPARCVELLAVTPPGGLERLPVGIRQRLERMAAIATSVADVHRGMNQRNIAAIVGAMAQLSGHTGNWGMHVQADKLIEVVGYPRIRKRLVDLVASGPVARENQWLVDCVMAMGELEDVALAAGISGVELEKAISGS